MGWDRAGEVCTSMVELLLNSEAPVRKNDLSLQDYEINGCSDGTCGGQRYFSCVGNRALFVPANKCSPDSRLGCYEEPAAASPG